MEQALPDMQCHEAHKRTRPANQKKLTDETHPMDR